MSFIQETPEGPREVTLFDLRRQNPSVSFPSVPTPELLAEYDTFPLVSTEPPVIDPEVEALESEPPVRVGDAYETRFSVRPLTDEEVIQRTRAEDEARRSDPQALARAQSLVALKTIDVDTLTDEEVAEIAILYPEWSPDDSFELNDVRYWKGKLWRCVQGHPGQSDRQPGTVPALWTPFRDPTAPPAPWVQPTGAQDAYALNERVTHPRRPDDPTIWIFESLIPANTTEPGVSPIDQFWLPVAPA